MMQSNSEKTFDEMYPNIKPITDTIEFEGSALLAGNKAEPCFNCGTPTKFVDIYFEGPLCSPRCEKVQWEKYFEALRK